MKNYGKPIILIVDNAPSHSNMCEFPQKDEINACKILRFPPYGPIFDNTKNI